MNRIAYRQFHFERAADGEQIPVVASTDHPVQRDGYIEILSHREKAVDLSRAPLPLIESHDRDRLNIGLIEDLRTVAGKLRGHLKMGASQRAHEVLQDIRNGIVRSVSVGYEILSETWSDDGLTVTADRWRPFEVSLVSVPADPGAGFYRSSHMENPQNQEKTDKITVLKTERERVRQIRQLFELHPGHENLMFRSIDDGLTVDQVRAALLDELGSRTEPAIRAWRTDESASQRVPSRHTRIGEPFGGIGPREFREAAVDALCLRGGVPIDKPHPAAQDLRHASMAEIARTCLRERGVDTDGLAPKQLLTRAMGAGHSTDDFPWLLANVANKALGMGFDMEPASHRIWTTDIEVPDFKEATLARRSEAPELLLVLEGGEYQGGSFPDEGETYQVQTYGRIFTITRQALINDDLQSLTALPQAFGASGARKECDQVYEILTANGNLSDGIALFDAQHGNLAAAGAAPTLTSLGAARAATRVQTGPNGSVLNIVPMYLIVPAALETVAENLLNSVSILNTAIGSTTGEVTSPSQFVSSLQLVVDARLDLDSTTAWYVAASPLQVDTIYRAYLSGQRGISTEEERDFSTKGYGLSASLDFCAFAGDYRGLYKNPGA